MSDRLEEIEQRYGFDQLDSGNWSGTPLADLLWLIHEVRRTRESLDMVAEEREAWKSRVLGTPRPMCRHAEL